MDEKREGPRPGRPPTPPGEDPERKPVTSRGLLWLILLALALFWLGPFAGTKGSVRTLTYRDFLTHLAAGEVRDVRVAEHEVRGVVSLAEEEGAEPTDVDFRAVRIEDPELAARLEEAGVDYTGERENPLWSLLLSWLFPIALLVVLFVWLGRSARTAGTQMMGFGRSKAHIVPETGTGVTFDDVAGCDEAKQDLREMVEFLKNPGRFTALGAKIPKGILLLGPPGTGKTLLARAVAGEAAVPFFSMSGSSFVEMFVGVGAARVRDLFVQAKAKVPCIVFIDEIDAVGRQRGVQMGVVNDEREQTLNQLLSEMDGFEENSGVILLAATNRPEILDRALLRPGRFDRQVVLDAPDRAGREAILRVHARGKPLAPGTDLGEIARATPGMSGADLANAMNEAALATARDMRKSITQADIEQAIERVMAGPERRSRRLDAEEKRRVAFHEAGHAVVASTCPHSDPVQKVSIVPRGRAALGYTLQLPETEQYLRTTEELRDRLRVLLAGRAAEELVLGEASTGAQDDLATATALARQMVCMFGMSDRLGLPHCARPAEGVFLRGDGALQRDCSEATAREIDEEVRRILDEARESAHALLVENRRALDSVAATLLEQETLDKTELERLLEGATRSPEAPRSGLPEPTHP